MKRKSKAEAQSPSGRPARVGASIRTGLSEMLRDGTLSDPRLEKALVTITDVSVSADLQNARAYFSVFSDDQAVIDGVAEALQSAVGVLRQGVGVRLGLRYTPRLSMHMDASLRQAARVEGILKTIRDDGTPGEVADPDSD